MDYFDRCCAKESSEICEYDESVDVVWKNRILLAAPHKKDLSKIFYESFLEVINWIHDGYEPSLDEIRGSQYWKYISGYHPNWKEKPLSRKADLQMRFMFRNGIGLYHDIKKRGMIDPLCMIVEPYNTCLYRGNRRLVILKVLGTKIARICCVTNKRKEIR